MEKTRVDEQEISLKRMLEQCLRNFGKVSIVGVVRAVMFVVLIFIKDVGEYNVAVKCAVSNSDNFLYVGDKVGFTDKNGRFVYLVAEDASSNTLLSNVTVSI
mgnify:CR=1 FL=1